LRLSYIAAGLFVGLPAMEPGTSRLSSARSSHLSERPQAKKNATGHVEVRAGNEAGEPDDQRPIGSNRPSRLSKLLRKEVIQPQVPLRLPCYDFTPITNHTLGACVLAVSSATSGTTGFRGVTGGVYKARERIQRSLLICAY